MNCCPKCKSVLLWGDNITKDTQDCFCVACGSKYIARFNVVEE